MTKYRVIELKDGKFYPKVKVGLFSRWKFLRCDADMLTYPTFEIFVMTNNPEKSAQFTSAQHANEFLKRTRDAVDEGVRKQLETP